MSLIESIIHKEGIRCEFEGLDGYLYALPGNEFKDLDKEYAAAQRAGVEVELLAHVPGLSFDAGPCVRYKRQAQAIVREGSRKLAAVYRDQQDQLHGVSAKCTHLGCIVHWDSAEHTWNCPCHGSRFDIDGEVLHEAHWKP